MPPRPHRTVDRVVQILELVSLSSRGLSLAELAIALNAAKSSIQELTNGLVARGYLAEEDHRFHLGPGPFVLAARANRIAAMSLDHQFIADLSKMVGCFILVGIRVGDALVHVDHVGDTPVLEYVARTHVRRPLYSSASGKILLSTLPRDEMNRLLNLASPDEFGAVQQFLGELPEIRSRGLAFNREATLDNAWAASTPLHGADGKLIAAITASVDRANAHRLDEVGEELKSAVATLRPEYGLAAR